MRRRPDPWKWPVTGLAVLLLLGGLLLVPAAWVDSFFSPLDLREDPAAARTPRWLAILPPPEIEAVPPASVVPPVEDPARPRPPREDPRWWTAGWEVRTGAATAAELRPAGPDSAAVVLRALGLGEDILTRVRPDSVMARRLLLLRHEDSFRFDELKPYLAAMAKARNYADMMSRAADMYGEHLQAEIMTPD
jgi:hypothetical protein